MRRSALARPGALFVLVGVMIGCWVVLVPPGGGPDEVSHLVRAGGTARGQGGDDAPGGSLFELPDSYLLPDVTCWTFQPTVPVSCATDRSVGETIEIHSRADGYPIWSHLYAGAASRLPGLDPLWWARAANALVATALVAAALTVVRDRPLAVAGVLTALTPMAWFTFAIVNPSSSAIAGAVALWTGLLHRHHRRSDWLIAAGWVALALPRRDGLIWACIALGAILLFERRGFVEWWRSFGRGPQTAIALSTVAAMAWGVTSGSRVSQLVVLAPAAIVAVELWQRAAAATTPGSTHRVLVTAATGLLAALATVVILAARPGGWDGALAASVVGQTGQNLEEAIGLLGWLDTPLPRLAIVGWAVVVGGLCAVAATDDVDLVRLAIGVLGMSVATMWVFELYQGNTSGTYWQGRYSLPVLVGVPIALGATRLRPEVERSVAWPAVAAVLAILNVATIAAARRWAVGVDGSDAPWDWDTYGTILPPVVVLALHAAASLALLVSIAPAATARDETDQPGAISTAA